MCHCIVSMRRAVLLGLIVTIHSTCGLNVTVYPTNAYGIENENLEVRAFVTTPFKQCSFGLGNITISASESPPGTEYWEEDPKSTCLMRLKPMKNEMKGTWNVTVMDMDGSITSKNVAIFMNDAAPVLQNTTVEAMVGSSFFRRCPYYAIWDYVKIYHPDGTLAEEGPTAEIKLPFVTSRDAGTWKCEVLVSNSLTQQNHFLTLRVISNSQVEHSVNETATQVNLLCGHSGLTDATCIFETPGGRVIASRPAVYTDRYSFYGQSDSHCGLSIRKPLLDEEKGIWRCMMQYAEYASFLQVGESMSQSNAVEKSQNKSVIAGTELTLQCRLKMPLTYCYLRSPLGRVFSSLETDTERSEYRGQGLGQGDCKIRVTGQNVWKNESGIWMCGMGAQEAVYDIQVPIHVQIAANQFSAPIPIQQASIGDIVELKCNSLMGYGLIYCRFMHPSGRSLNLGPQSQVEHYTYSGTGLNNGDCGLKINAVTSSDFGKWTCAASFVGKQWPSEFQDVIILNQSTMTTTTLIWMSVVLGLAAMGLVSGLMYWRRQQRTRARRGVDPPMLLGSDSIQYRSRLSQVSGDSENVEPVSTATQDSHSS